MVEIIYEHPKVHVYIIIDSTGRFRGGKVYASKGTALLEAERLEGTEEGGITMTIYEKELCYPKGDW
jgi:hypothetical protein